MRRSGVDAGVALDIRRVGVIVEVDPNPIASYAHFVRQYNLPYNVVDG